MLTRKTLLQLSGAMLIFLGLSAIFKLFASSLAAASPGPADEKLKFIISLSIFLYIISGIALFFFKEWSRKLAIVAYIIALSHLIVNYLDGYRHVVCYKYAYSFTHVGIIRDIFIISFFIIVLALMRDQFQQEENAKRPIVEAAILISILVVFYSLFFSAVILGYREYRGEMDIQKTVELLNRRIQNDPRFKEVSFRSIFSGFAYRDILEVSGIVKNEGERRALQELVASYELPLKIREGFPDIIRSPWPSDTHPVILVNIGSIDSLDKQQVIDLLNQNDIRNHLVDTHLSSPNVCAIYVSPAKKEEAIKLLRGYSGVSKRYSEKSSYYEDYRVMEVGGKRLINMGFIEKSHKNRIFDLLKENGIKSFINCAQLSGYDVCYIFVSRDAYEEANKLLKRDLDLTVKEEYCINSYYSHGLMTYRR